MKVFVQQVKFEKYADLVCLKIYAFEKFGKVVLEKFLKLY